MPPIKKIQGRAVPIKGRDIDTDRIVPARFLKTITFEKRAGTMRSETRRTTL